MKVYATKIPRGYLATLVELHGAPDAHRKHWRELTHAQQLEAVRRLADSGLGDYEIASACALSVEMVRSIVGERAK